MTKIIHYCWFGGHEIPKNLQKCLDSWVKLMPEYKIKKWDESTFDVNSTEWTKSAYHAKKYAFVADYVRLKALYDYGGIYLDTDVLLKKSLSILQEKYSSFMGFENGSVLTSAVICMESSHPILKDFLDYYKTAIFSKSIITGNEANVHMMTVKLKNYGLLTNNKEQDLTISTSKLHIFPRTYFCPLDFYHNKDFSKNTYAIHYFDASWLDGDTKKRIEKERKLLYKVKFYLLQKLHQHKKLFKK